MTIKAIETHYKGYRFRSRTEARWAVFFDSLGVEWEYEVEGFELPTGEWYLPDFRVSTVFGHSYMEVKAKRPSFAEFGKLAHLMSHQNRYAVFLIGTPDAANVETLLHADFEGEFASRDFEPVSLYGMTFAIDLYQRRQIIAAVKNARSERFGERGQA